jgi:hypothetical protein
MQVLSVARTSTLLGNDVVNSKGGVSPPFDSHTASLVVNTDICVKLECQREDYEEYV